MKQYRRAASILVVRPTNVCSPDGCGQVFTVLLVHKPRKRDAWQLPQGGIEEGESVSAAALRELREETALQIPEVLFESGARYQYDFSKGFLRRFRPKNAGQELLFVVAEDVSDQQVCVDNREIDQFRWVLPEDIGKYIVRAEYLTIILQLVGEYRRKKLG